MQATFEIRWLHQYKKFNPDRPICIPTHRSRIICHILYCISHFIPCINPCSWDTVVKECMNQLIWSAGSPLYENSADFENGLKHDSINKMAPHRNKSSSNSNMRHPRCVLYNSKELGMLTLNVEHTLSQLLSAAAQGVTYIILTDCTYSCPSLSNYTYILYYITLYYTP